MTLLLAIIFAAHATARCPSDPAAMTRWIYTNHFEFYAAGKGNASFLSPRLFSLLQRDWKCEESGYICAIDAVPWTDAQDGEMLEPIRYQVVSNDGKTATVDMTYEFGIKEKHKPRSARITLVKDARTGCWLLDDMLTGSDPSIRRQLETYDYSKP